MKKRINIEQTRVQIKVRDLVNGYLNSEENGVFAFGGNLNVRPAYQREFVYDDEKRALVIDSVACNIDLGKLYWSDNVDGKKKYARVFNEHSSEEPDTINGGVFNNPYVNGKKKYQRLLIKRK